MDFHFPADLQAYVDQMIARGAFSDVTELMIDAVRRQRDGYMDWKRKHDELKGEIQLGIDDLGNGHFAELDLDDVLRRAKEVVRSRKPRTKRSAQ